MSRKLYWIAIGLNGVSHRYQVQGVPVKMDGVGDYKFFAHHFNGVFNPNESGFWSISEVTTGLNLQSDYDTLKSVRAQLQVRLYNHQKSFFANVKKATPVMELPEYKAVDV